MEDEERLKQLIEEAVENALAPLVEPQQTLLISRSAAAKRLVVTAPTLWRWSKVGYLPVTAYVGRQAFYSEEAIHNLEEGVPLARARHLTPIQQPLSPYVKRR